MLVIVVLMLVTDNYVTSRKLNGQQLPIIYSNKLLCQGFKLNRHCLFYVAYIFGENYMK